MTMEPLKLAGSEFSIVDDCLIFTRPSTYKPRTIAAPNSMNWQFALGEPEKLRDWLLKVFPLRARGAEAIKADTSIPNDAKAYMCAFLEGLQEKAHDLGEKGILYPKEIYELLAEAMAAGADAVLSAQSDGAELPSRSPEIAFNEGTYWMKSADTGGLVQVLIGPDTFARMQMSGAATIQERSTPEGFLVPNFCRKKPIQDACNYPNCGCREDTGTHTRDGKLHVSARGDVTHRPNGVEDLHPADNAAARIPSASVEENERWLHSEFQRAVARCTEAGSKTPVLGSVLQIWHERLPGELISIFTAAIQEAQIGSTTHSNLLLLINALRKVKL